MCGDGVDNPRCEGVYINVDRRLCVEPVALRPPGARS